MDGNRQWVPEIGLGRNGVGPQGRKRDSFIKYCSTPGSLGVLKGFCIEVA